MEWNKHSPFIEYNINTCLILSHVHEFIQFRRVWFANPAPSTGNRKWGGDQSLEHQSSIRSTFIDNPSRWDEAATELPSPPLLSLQNAEFLIEHGFRRAETSHGNAARVANAAWAGAGSRARAKEAASSDEAVAAFQEIDQQAPSRRGPGCRRHDDDGLPSGRGCRDVSAYHHEHGFVPLPGPNHREFH